MTTKALLILLACTSMCSARRMLQSSGSIKAAYWGQGSASTTLASVCGRYDIVFLSFLPDFGNGQDVTSNSAINIAGHSLSQTATDIGTCQGQGKKIILSMGGGVGNYGFTSAADAKSTATKIWNAYLGGSGTNRPFGSVKLDGVDLDVEMASGAQYYSDFAKTLKGLYTGKKYYLTAVPQCPYPDNNLGPKSGTVLGDSGSLFDYVSIQFYNNPSCAGSNTVSGYGPWNTWAAGVGVKLLPTFPASSSDAGSGYQPASTVAGELKQLSSDSTYGGWNLFTAEDDNGFSSQLGSSSGSTSPSSPSSPSGPSGCQSYTVKSGDTCYSIWTAHGQTEAQFDALNPGINCSNLQIGQQVCA